MGALSALSVEPIRVEPAPPVAIRGTAYAARGAPPSEPEPPPDPVPTVPRSVSIPRIGVDAEVIRLGLTADGALEVPEDFGRTGWWQGGSVPGLPGPAVIVGHVDSKAGPAVFYRLDELSPGDVIEVGSAGGTVSFAVERLEQHPKDAFPSDAVYGPTPGPSLRLITCAGSFDHDSGHYRDNLIVFASPVSS